MIKKKTISKPKSNKVIQKNKFYEFNSPKIDELILKITPYFKLFLRWFVVPSVLYLAIFFISQPSYFFNFSQGFYLDSGDGFQNVWNIWWVDHSLTNAADPYFTTYLHWPHGTSLVPQTMNIFNGLMGIPLMNIFGLTLVQAVNFAVVFSFVIGGVTMFWFVQKLHKTYWVSLVAGALFTFSSYHFAHAIGHLQLVSLEWIPLFLLAFWVFLERLTYRHALFAALSLFLVLLCDYYYLFWSVIVAGLWVVWKLYKKDIILNKKTILVMSAFAALCLTLVGPLIYSLLHLNKIDPLQGSHDPVLFSMDPFSVAIPGGSWYWGELTQRYWSHLAYIPEASVFFGFGVLTVLAVAAYKMFIKYRTFAVPQSIYFWWIILVVFFLLAMGPRLSIMGHVYNRIPLPYAVMEKLFPTLSISGMPVRWVLISLIAAIVIVSYMLTRIELNKRKGMIVAVIFIGVTCIDLYPAPLPLTSSRVLPYVYTLKGLPDGAVINNAALSEPQQLRDQTIHEKPMPFGYVSRLPKSVGTKDFLVFAALEQGRYRQLCSIYKVRYVTVPPSRPLKITSSDVPTLIYQDNDALIYDMKNSKGGC